MRYIKEKLLSLLFALAVFFGLMMVQNVSMAAEYPQVGDLKPFTAESDYMSLPGYLRYLTFVQNGVWISHHQSVVVVRQQENRTSSY